MIASLRVRLECQTSKRTGFQPARGQPGEWEDPLFVAQQMGHSTTEMIMRHYERWVEQAEEKHRHVFCRVLVSLIRQPITRR